MKILIVCSYNQGSISPFISEQVDSLKCMGLSADYFLIKGSGIFGYIKNLPKLKRTVTKYQADIIHAHYGLSGLLAIMQRKIPVVITFHGSDINTRKIWPYSKLASLGSKANIFVSSKLRDLLPAKNNHLIPCGVDFELFKLVDKNEARIKLGLSLDKKYILFSSSFDNTVKNYPLAISAIDNLNDSNTEFIELIGYTRAEVVLLMNAVDVALMTSFSEGSPQFIKESMACNCPIVTTDVGDVREVIGKTEGCHICSIDPKDVARKIEKALIFNSRTNGRNNILNLENTKIAQRIVLIYETLCKKGDKQNLN